MKYSLLLPALLWAALSTCQPKIVADKPCPPCTPRYDTTWHAPTGFTSDLIGSREAATNTIEFQLHLTKTDKQIEEELKQAARAWRYTGKGNIEVREILTLNDQQFEGSVYYTFNVARTCNEVALFAPVTVCDFRADYLQRTFEEVGPAKWLDRRSPERIVAWGHYHDGDQQFLVAKEF